MQQQCIIVSATLILTYLIHLSVIIDICGVVTFALTGICTVQQMQLGMRLEQHKGCIVKILALQKLLSQRVWEALYSCSQLYCLHRPSVLEH